MADKTSEQDPNMRAAEYVLGTLSAEDTTKLESEFEHDHALQLEVAYWEEQLGQLGLQLEPVEPPAQVWNAIWNRTNEDAGSKHPRVSPMPRRPARLWQGLAVAASVVAVVLAGMLYIVASKPSQMMQPTYASMLYDKPTSTGWLVTANAQTDEMTIMAMGSYPLPEGKELRLWIMPEDGKAMASGVIPPDGQSRWHMSTRVAKMLEQPATRFVVTMEDAGEPVSDGPEGPVMWQAPVIQHT